MDKKYLTGLILAELRKKRGVGLNKLARDLGVNQSYISKIENGKKPLSFETREKILKYFNKTNSWLTNEANKRSRDYVKKTEISYSNEVNTTDRKLKRYYKKNDCVKILTRELKPLLAKNFFQPGLIQSLASVYEDVMDKYFKSEHVRRIYLVQDVMIKLFKVREYDLAIDKDILQPVDDFIEQYSRFLQKELSKEEDYILRDYPDHRGVSKEIIEDDKAWNRHVLDLISPNQSIVELIKIEPSQFKKHIFAEFFNLLHSSLKLNHSKKTTQHSQIILLSSLLCRSLDIEIPRVLYLDENVEEQELIKKLKIEDVDFSFFGSGNLKNPRLLGNDKFTDNENQLVKRYCNFLRKILNSPPPI